MFSIRITVNNLSQTIGFLKSIPGIARPVAIQAFAKYMLDKLRAYPNYQYVSRKQAYGKSFFSLAQQRWFFANNPPIGNNRTFRLQAGWRIQSGGGKTFIINPVPYAGWVLGTAQARQPALVGWSKVWDTLMNNMNGGIAAAQRAVDAALHSK